MSERFAVSSQAIGFRKAPAAATPCVGPRFPLSRHDNPGGVGGLAFVNWRPPERGKELPRTVWLLLLDNFLRDPRQFLFCPVCRCAGTDCAATRPKQEPHVQPSTLWAWVGRISRIGKDLRGHQFVPTAQQGLGRIRQEFLVDRVSMPIGFAQRPKRHRHVMAGGTPTRIQPSGAFGLQIADGTIDRLLNLRDSRGGNQSGNCSRHLSLGGRCKTNAQRQYDE